jgi:tetratricopeptide (TPR) repeat protein
MTGAFIGRRRDRLGARLLTLLNCMRLAKDYGHPFLLDWFPPGHDAPELEHPEELFEPDWTERHMVHLAGRDGGDRPEVTLWEFQSDRDPSRMIDALASGHDVVVDEGFLVAVLPWEDAGDVHARHGKLIEEVGFGETVASRMAQIDRRIAGWRFTAYHLRRGDIIDRPPWTHKTWPAKIEVDELYKAHMHNAQGELGIVFSDTKQSFDALARHVPSAQGIEDIIDFSGLSAAQRDLLELYAMSRADQIVAPSISAFSSAAARIAGKERLTFRDVLDEQEIDGAYDALAERMATSLAEFPSTSDAAHHYGRLHSHLTAKGRIRDAWSLGKALEDTDCDRAFLPVLLALNEFYLRQWKACEITAQAGLEHPDLWPEDHAVLTAILAAALGAQGRRAAASQTFARAFWAKPMRPDVAVIGSRLLYRGALKTKDFPPIAWDLLAHVRKQWFPPFINLSLVQHRFIRRRPVNFDLVLLDWPDLALDQRARRLASDRARLEALLEGVSGADPEGSLTDHVESAMALLGARLGVPAKDSVDRSAAILARVPDNALFRKRHADILAATGDEKRARRAYRDLVEAHPDDAYLAFAASQFLIRSGQVGEGEDLVLRAAATPTCSAAIHGEAGRILLRRDALVEALPQLRTARRLCPSYGRFDNQIARIEEKLSKATAQKLPV